MKKNIDKVLVTPLPVLMVGTYDEDGNADVMNVAWGGQCSGNHVSINLAPTRKTKSNLDIKKEFTVAFATEDTYLISDYFGLASGNDTDKIEATGVTVKKAEKVDAPVIEEYPVTLECKVISIEDIGTGRIRYVGEIVNVQADEEVLDEDGKISVPKLNPIVYDSAARDYYTLGKKVGNAFSDGSEYMK